MSSVAPRRTPRARRSAVTALRELDDLHESCEQAWRDYLESEWPRGAFDVWRANDERLCAALERNMTALELTTQKHFTRNAGA